MMRRKVGKLLGDRRVVGGFLLLIQLAIVMFGVSWASTEYHWLTPALTVLSVIIVVWLVRKYDNPMYKITWMLVIVLLPLFGGLFYLFWGNTPLNREMCIRDSTFSLPCFSMASARQVVLSTPPLHRTIAFSLIGCPPSPGTDRGG